jgi:hypothetical protein
MADGKGGSALLVCVAIGVGLALADGALTTETSTGTTTETTTTETTTGDGSGSTTTARSSSTVVVTSDTTTAPAPLASCPGRVVGESTENDITLRLYYDGQAKGVNCVSAVHHGTVTPPGYLRIEIRFADYTGTSWPEFASQDGAPGATEVTGTYLIGTDNRCVSAAAKYFPSGAGGASSVSLAKVACG